MTFGALTGWARVHTPSASRPAIAAAFGPNADMYTGIRRGGQVVQPGLAGPEVPYRRS